MRALQQDNTKSFELYTFDSNRRGGRGICSVYESGFHILTTLFICAITRTICFSVQGKGRILSIKKWYPPMPSELLTDPASQAATTRR
jgi:hypothetical protein